MALFNYTCYHVLLTQSARREEARKRIEALGEPFKLEILDSIKTEPITLYHVGDQWWDLCAGPHVETTGKRRCFWGELTERGVQTVLDCFVAWFAEAGTCSWKCKCCGMYLRCISG